LCLARAPRGLVEAVEPVVGGARVERAHLRGVGAQRREPRLPARVAVGLDLRKIGERRPDMADRGQLVETTGAIGAKALLAQPPAASRIVDIDLGADHQHQRPGGAASRLLGGDRLREHLSQRGLAGGIAGLAAAGEVEEQIHEFGRRGVAAAGRRRGCLRRSRRGEDDEQAQHEGEEPEISHARIPSVTGHHLTTR
jgi:hypothetical protein